MLWVLCEAKIIGIKCWKPIEKNYCILNLKNVFVNMLQTGIPFIAGSRDSTITFTSLWRLDAEDLKLIHCSMLEIFQFLTSNVIICLKT